MKISVGPAPSHWGKNKIESLYRELAQSPVDYVYLGETACPDRLCFSPDFVGKLCDELTRAGKEVYVSSFTLVRDEKQYRVFRDLAWQVRRVEINSPAFLGFARCYPAVLGTFLNVYNSTAANILAEHKVERIVLPPELSFQSVASISKNCTVPTELVAHGHIPIAISGTCQTVRSLGYSADECGKVCQRYPEGMVLNAGDQPLFRIEGPQTLSAMTYCLVEYLPQLEKAGVDTVRILPQYEHTGRIVRIYRDVLEHQRNCRDALKELKAISPGGLCNGWFLGKAGWIYESSDMPPASTANHYQPFFMIPQGKLEKKSVQEPCGIDGVASGDLPHTWSNDDIIRELNQLVEVMNRDPQLIEQVTSFKGATLVLSATDTGREFVIGLDKQGVRVRPYAGESFDAKIRATERVLWAVLSGQMDADSAFFAGKASVCGSVITAFHVKNRFLSLLQKHLPHRLKANNKLAMNSYNF
jgi:collagenase-like PrtC family protease/predicted lipid carrier protein YhbT